MAGMIGCQQSQQAGQAVGVVQPTPEQPTQAPTVVPTPTPVLTPFITTSFTYQHEYSIAFVESGCPPALDFRLTLPPGYVTASFDCGHSLWGHESERAMVGVQVQNWPGAYDVPHLALDDIEALMAEYVGVPQPGLTVRGESVEGTQTTHSVEQGWFDGRRAIIMESTATATEALPCEWQIQTVVVLSPRWSAFPETKDGLALMTGTCREDVDVFADDLAKIKSSFEVVR